MKPSQKNKKRHKHDWERVMFRGVLLAAMCAVGIWGRPAMAGLDDVKSVSDLLSDCKSAIRIFERRSKTVEDLAKGMVCKGYFWGFEDAHASLGLSSGQKLYCRPDKIRVFDFVRIFIKWAEDNPQQLQIHPAHGVTFALSKAFPCKK